MPESVDVELMETVEVGRWDTRLCSLVRRIPRSKNGFNFRSPDRVENLFRADDFSQIVELLKGLVDSRRFSV